MSFDLDIETCDTDGNLVLVPIVDSHTYNLAPMWVKALPIKKTSDLDGWKCAEHLPDLEAGLLDAVRNADQYRAMEPSNGWGDYDGFLETLIRFVSLAFKHPSGTVRWHG
ncbi:hypothetical protein C6401_15305 [Arthrobacter woluwensis]|uniref:hypothetical protein n=1 Tax=Arthrobacter woluwensis TaxID=156980 RepID=UPI000D121E73|nr:hypothetical protein [Arthrobacter woluwensis]PSS42922.1 hypothetical protein C6401_15305 [Arthrobacter woluwensis]